MAKKRTTTERLTLNIRYTQKDRDLFREAAELDGFNSVTAWLLYHLRRIARETIKRSSGDS
ncbi:MAG: type II toxin -antitoxin system TacA 1-like antitoxin [Planctomycetota bacterium]|jgi:uncharacterized protein (DUF1778 family)